LLGYTNSLKFFGPSAKMSRKEGPPYDITKTRKIESKKGTI
jgi:hypothetical protein